ncbi:MAG: hypothetical protein NUV83_02280 [Candidatus Wolfebacteria bacterium]|nr:hypothetical protein [Candidatus Wolfebacteria bacterium]
MDKDYLSKIKERTQKARVYKKFQATGLEIAEILGDLPHKSLYIKLAKENNEQQLRALAKTISQNKKIAKKGAYFMSMLKTLKK